MTSIDQKVVQMVFDNDKFESAVKTTMNTIENLNDKLNVGKVSKGFNELEKAAENVKLSSLSDNVEKVSNRFSALGVVGMTALANITTYAMNAGKSLLSSLTSPLIEGGKRRAQNIEQAKFQIEGLGFEWNKVKEDILYGVKDTAYGLDEAAKAAGSLLASNVKTGKSMKTVLRGISGAAAMTNSEYSDIARIFTTIAGNGRLMSDQLNQFAVRGLNVSALLAKSFNKTEGEIREMVKKGEIDFMTFAQVMDDAFGAHAKEANKTFTGALSNMKAALARIGADFFTPGYENLRDVINSFTPVIDSVHEALNPLIDTAAKGMKVASKFAISLLDSFDAKTLTKPISDFNSVLVSLAKSVINIFKAIGQVASPIFKAFNYVFGPVLSEFIVNAAKSLEKFTEMLIMSNRMSGNLRGTFYGIFEILAALFRVLTTVIGAVGGTLFTVIVKTFGFFADILLRITYFLYDVIYHIKEFFIDLSKLETVKNIIAFISNTFETLRNAVTTAAESMHEFVYMIANRIFTTFGSVVLNGILNSFKFIAENIDKAVQKIKELISKVRDLPIIQDITEKATKAFSTLQENAAGLTSQIGEKLRTAIGFAKGAFLMFLPKLKEFGDKLYSTFEFCKTNITNFITKLKELASQYMVFPSLQEVVTSIQKMAVDAFSNGVNVFSNLKELIVNIVEKVKELGSLSLSTIISNFTALNNKILGVIDVSSKIQTVKNFFGFVSNGFVEFSKETGVVIEGVKENILGFFDWIKKTVASISLGDLLAAAAGASMIAFFVSLTRLIDSLRSVIGFLETINKGISLTFKGLFGILESVSGVLDGVAKYISDQGTAVKMKAVTEIIKSVVLLAGAIALLATMDQERVKTSAAVMLILATALVGLSTAMAYILKDVPAEGLAKYVGSMIAISGSLLVLVFALKMLSSVDMNGIVDRLAILTILMGELVAAVVIMGKAEKEVSSGTFSLIAISVSMLLMAKAMAILGGIKISEIGSALVVMGAIMGFIALAMVISSKANPAALAGMVGVAVSISIITSAIKKFAGISTETLAKGIIGLTVVMFAMQGLMLAVSFAGKYAIRAGASMILMAFAIGMLAVTIERLADINPSMMTRAATTIAQMLGIFAAITAITLFAGPNAAKAGVAIVMMSGAMLLIAAAIAVLSKLDPEGLERATYAVSIVMGMFALVIAATSVAKNANSTIKYIAITMLALAGALAILSLLDPKNLATAALSMTMLGLVFAIILQSTPMAKGSIPGLLAILGVIVVLAVVLYKLSEIDYKSSLATAASLSLLLLSLAAAVDIMQFLSPAALKGVLVGVAAFAIIIAAIGALMIAIGALVEYVPEIKKFLKNAIPVLEDIGRGIGSFFGGIAAGFTSSASTALADIGTNLSKFMENVQPFLEGASKIDGKVQNGIDSLISMVLGLAASDFINGLNIFGSAGSSIKNLSQSLPMFGLSLKLFSLFIEGVDTNSLSKAASAAKNLAEMAAVLPRSGGIMGMFTGDPGDMEAFGESLVSFGKSLKKYGNAVKDAEFGAISDSVKPAKALAQLASLIPGKGGLVQNIAGEQDLQEFGKSLVTFGVDLLLYSAIVKGLDAKPINDSIKPAEALMKMATLVQSHGGAIAAFVGDNKLDDFGYQLVSFGNSLKEYSTAVGGDGGINVDAIKTSTEAAKGIIEIANMLDKEYGGLLSYVFGDDALYFLAGQLKEFGEGLAEYAEAVDGINVKAITDSVPAAKAVVDIANSMGGYGVGLAQLIGGGFMPLLTVAAQLAPFGQALKKYSKSVEGINMEAIKNSVPASKYITEAISKMPNIFQSIGGLVGAGTIGLTTGALGDALKNFSKKVENVDPSSVRNAASATITLSTAVKRMPGLGDFISKIGSNFMLENAFGTLGDAISSYASKTASSDYSGVNKSVEALKSLMTLKLILGDTSVLVQAGDNIKTFGEKFNEFATNVSGDYSTQVESFLATSKKIKTEITSFANIDLSGIDGVASSIQNLSTNVVTNFVNSFKEGSGSASKAAASMVNNAMTAAQNAIKSAQTKFSLAGSGMMAKLAAAINVNAPRVSNAVDSAMLKAKTSAISTANSFATVGEEMMAKIGSGMGSRTATLNNAIKGILLLMANTAASTTNSFKKVGEAIMGAIATGVLSKKGAVTNAISSGVKNAANSIGYSQFYKIGQYMSQGLANGVRDKRNVVVSAAINVANAAAKAMKDAVKEKSPSKVTQQIGAYMSEGLAIGILDEQSMVEKASTKLANAAVDATAVVLASISDTLDDSMEMQPVITPVLDSTQLENGTSFLSSQMNDAFGIDMTSTSGFVSAVGKLEGIRYAQAQAQNSLLADQAKMSEQIAKLNDSFNSFAAETNQDVNLYIDGKRIASTIAKPINQKLGAIQKAGGIA